MKHQVLQLNGSQPWIELPYECKIITEGWEGWLAFLPYLVYMPEKDRLLLLITRRDFEPGDLNPWGHHNRPMLMYSDDHGDTWSQPTPVFSDAHAELSGDALSLTYLGDGKVIMLSGETGGAWWIGQDYGEKWERLSASRGGIWNPLLVDFDSSTGGVNRLVEPSCSAVRPWPSPLLLDAPGPLSQAYLRFSLDQGRSWGEEIKVPQWLGVNEVTLARAANGDLVAACRTDMAKPFERLNDEYGGMGVSTSKDDGRTWSELNMLFNWGRHHPSIVCLSTGELVMSYLVRRGYPDTPDGQFLQFGDEAVVSFDHGQSWDLDHRYILCKYHGCINRREGLAWEGDTQNTSSVLLPNDEIVTVFGIGPRTGRADYEPHHYYPRDIGLVRWRINRHGLNHERTISDAPYDSDLRNKLDINPPSRPTPGRTNLAMADFGVQISASDCLAAPEFMLYDPYVFTEQVAFFTNPAWVEVKWPEAHQLDEIVIEGQGLGDLQPPGSDIQDGCTLQLYQDGEWRDFSSFKEATKTSTWVTPNSLCPSCIYGRDKEFKYVHRFDPVLAKGIRLQWSFQDFSTAPDKRPYITHLEIMGWQ